MHPMMVKKLIERDVIRQGTEVEAMHKTHGLSCRDDSLIRGQFAIHSASVIGDGTNVVLTTRSVETGRIYRFEADNIITLDGMTSDRLASIYAMTETGEEVAQGKRRGRRPKALIAQMAAEAEALRLAEEVRIAAEHAETGSVMIEPTMAEVVEPIAAQQDNDLYHDD